MTLDAPEQDILGDGRLVKTTIRHAEEESQRPKAGEKATVHYVCKLGGCNGKVIDSSRERGEPFRFVLGKNEALPGLEQGVTAMKVGELATFSVHPELAYGAAGCGGGVVPGFKPHDDSTISTLHFELELLEVDGANNIDEHILEKSPEERIRVAMQSKDSGNSHFKASELERALAAYSHALVALGFPHVGTTNNEEQKQNDEDQAWSDEFRQEVRLKIALACNLNAAQCCLRLDSATEAFQYASAALDLEPNSAKALFRRGSAAMVLGLFDRARSDLMDAARKEPNNVEVRVKLQACQEQCLAAEKKDRSTFGGMFNRADKST